MPEPETGATEPGTGVPEPETGATEPATGVPDPAAGAGVLVTGGIDSAGGTEPSAGALVPTTGAREPSVGATGEPEPAPTGASVEDVKGAAMKRASRARLNFMMSTGKKEDAEQLVSTLIHTVTRNNLENELVSLNESLLSGDLLLFVAQFKSSHLYYLQFCQEDLLWYCGERKVPDKV